MWASVRDCSPTMEAPAPAADRSLVNLRPRIATLVVLGALVVSGGFIVLRHVWPSSVQPHQSKPLHAGKRDKRTTYCIYVNSPNEC